MIDRPSNDVCVTSAITPTAARSATPHWLQCRGYWHGIRARALLSAFVWGTMKNDSVWRGALDQPRVSTLGVRPSKKDGAQEGTHAVQVSEAKGPLPPHQRSLSGDGR